MKRLALSISVPAMLACNSHATQPTADTVTSSPTPSASVASAASVTVVASVTPPPEPVIVFDPDAATQATNVDAGRGMFGDAIGDSFGAGGLGLTGVGEGGGGRGEGIGLGNTGTIGHGAGTGTGQGFNTGHGRLGSGHRVHAPRIRQGLTTMTGQLPPEVINRITRQNFGRFRLCYQTGLDKDPTLRGTVTTHFVIDGKGAVAKSEPAVSATTMPDPDVVVCVVKGFLTLSFPQPAAGVVNVTFPLTFEPG